MSNQANSIESGETQEIVVFSIISDSQCNKCKGELLKGSFLILREGQPLCLSCADMGDLVYLPSGNAALTRRTKKYTTKYAVVVKFSKARKRYERQGLLVEEPAFLQAKSELKLD